MKKAEIIKLYCPVCGVDQRVNLLAFVSNGQYRIFKCSYCQLVFSYPRPGLQELETLYDDFEMTKLETVISAKITSLYQGVLNYLVSKAAKKSKFKFLDYGFGAGEFLKKVSQTGFLAYGVEFDNRRCQEIETYARGQNSAIKCLNIRQAAIQEFAGVDFDFITLFQVIEHVLEPLKLLKELSSLQSSGKYLYIECPNNDAFFLSIKNKIRKFMNRESFFDSLRPPIHINGFNAFSLKALLEKAGYAPLEIGSYGCSNSCHQPENVFMYPSLFDLLRYKRNWNMDAFLRFWVRQFDLIGRAFGRGYGIFALAKKIR